jgi:hypothetical protein
MQISREHRVGPRIVLESLCHEIAGGRERPALVSDLSEVGLRLERPFVGGRLPREVQLELELPGVDDVLWAMGHVRFDVVRQVRGDLWRITGIRIAAAAARDLRTIRDVVHSR